MKRNPEKYGVISQHWELAKKPGGMAWETVDIPLWRVYIRTADEIYDEHEAKSLAAARKWLKERGIKEKQYNPSEMKSRKKNIQAFVDSKGRIHPIRASPDYDPEKEGKIDFDFGESSTKARHEREKWTVTNKLDPRRAVVKASSSHQARVAAAKKWGIAQKWIVVTSMPKKNPTKKEIQDRIDARWMQRAFVTGKTQPGYHDESKRGGGHKAAIRAWRKKYGTPHPHEIEAKRGKKKAKKQNATRLSMADIQKLGPKYRAQIEAQLGQVEVQEAKATTPKAKKAVAAKKRSLFARVKSLLSSRERAARKAEKLEAKAKKYRAKAARPTLRQRAKKAAAGKAHGLVSRILGNPPFDSSRYVSESGLNKIAFDHYAEEINRYLRSGQGVLTVAKRMREYHPSLTAHQLNVIMKAVRMARVHLSKQNPGKGKRRKSAKRKNSTVNIKAKKVVMVRKNKGRKRNSATDEAKRQRKSFSGKEKVGEKRIFMPEGAPKSGLSTLGPLKLLKMADGRKYKAAPGVWAVRDLKGHIYFGTTKQGGVIWNGPKEDLGACMQIEYGKMKKPHLGDFKPAVYWHRFSKPYPHLHADGQGGAMFKGGTFSIQAEGITG